MRIKGNEETNRTAKEAIDIPEVTTTTLYRLLPDQEAKKLRMAKGMGK